MAKLDIAKIKVKLQLKDRFLACIAMMLKWRECTKIHTLATDGIHLLYNPSFFESLSSDEQVGIVAHECMHVALQHPVRCKELGLKHKLYNVCADYVVNDELEKYGYTIPKGGLKCPTVFKGLATEEIYKKMDKSGISNDIDPEHEDITPEANGENKDKEKKTIKRLELVKNNIKKILTQAKMLAAGSGSGFSDKNDEFNRLYNELIKPKLPWERILYNYVNGTVQDDFSWRRPNRRYAEIGYLPSISNTDSLTKACVYIDVSGSVDDDLLNKFISEIKKLHNNLHLESIKIGFFSTSIKTSVTMEDTWKPIPNIVSGGGTRIDPVIEDINNTKPVVAVVLTDGYFDERPINDLKYPVIWCIYDNDNFSPSRGKVIEIEK